MIENANTSKSSAEFIDSKKYIGVASVNVLAINPDNNKLRSFGWNIPADAAEPEYSKEIVKEDHSVEKRARVRFMVQIQDLPEKPIIPLDFWIRPEVTFNFDKSKGKIIDAFGRTAWGTKEELKAGKIPTYSSGPASISNGYKLCHVGEEELVTFLLKYLNVTPLQVYQNGTFVASKNPGKLTIDNWQKICDGNVTELIEYIALQPENKVKIILGIQEGEDNKSYQTFVKTAFIGNGMSPDRNSGEYVRARKVIDKLKEEEITRKERNPNYTTTTTFDARPVHEWTVTTTKVEEHSVDETDFAEDSEDDLPFD